MYNIFKIKWLVFLKIYLKEINLNKDLNIRNILIANLLRELYIYFKNIFFQNNDHI